MRLLIAMMKHETNTFSPVPTPLARFARGSAAPYEGQEVHDAFKGTGTAIGAFIDLAEQAGAEAVYPVAGSAAPSAPVETEAYEYMAGRIVDAVASCSRASARSRPTCRSASRWTCTPISFPRWDSWRR